MRHNDTLCVINPKSGNGSAPVLAERLAPLAEVIDLTCVSFGEVLRKVSDHDKIVVVGGDGTFSSVMTGSLGGKQRFLPVPFGTGNDLCNELLAPSASDLIEAPETTLSRWFNDTPTHSIDIWGLRGESGKAHRFINYCSTGLDAAAVERVSAWRAGLAAPAGANRMRFAYIYHGLRSLVGAKVKATVDAEGKSISVKSPRSLIFANIRSFMGIGRSSSESRYDDGKLECIMPSTMGYPAMMCGRWIPSLLDKPVASCGTYRIDRLPSSALWQIDGEHVKERLGRTVTISRVGSVKVCAGGSNN